MPVIYTRAALVTEADALVGEEAASWYERQADDVFEDVMAEMGEPLWTGEVYLRALEDALRIVYARRLLAGVPRWSVVPS